MSQPLPPETLAQAAERVAISELSHALQAAHAAYAAAINTAIDAFVAARVAAHESERAASVPPRTLDLFPMRRRFPLVRDTRNG